MERNLRGVNIIMLLSWLFLLSFIVVCLQRARNGGYNYIIWSDKGMSPTEGDEDQDRTKVFREAKNFAKHM